MHELTERAGTVCARTVVKLDEVVDVRQHCDVGTVVQCRHVSADDHVYLKSRVVV